MAMERRGRQMSVGLFQVSAFDTTTTTTNHHYTPHYVE